jgi:hypothetical protein
MKVFSITIQDDKEKIFLELMNSVSFVKKIEDVSDDVEIPQWHKAVLDQRIEEKAEDYLTWDAVQKYIHS